MNHNEIFFKKTNCRKKISNGMKKYTPTAVQSYNLGPILIAPSDFISSIIG